MNKLLTIISIFMLSSMLFGKKHINPNGHPFTLNVAGQFEFDENFAFSANMPLASWLTIKGGFYSDRYEHYYSIGSGTYAFNGNSDLSYGVGYIGGELHIPIYKLWDK